MPTANLSHLTHSLQVPPDFARYENIVEEPAILCLDDWKENAHRILVEMRTLVEENASSLSLEEQGDLISAAASFEDSSISPWVSSASQSISQSKQ